MNLQISNTTDKIADVSDAITKAVVDMCQCPYTPDLIVDGRLLCSDDKSLSIYQALFLTTDGMTAEHIRNLTQEWVLTKPTITISSKTYQLDNFCSVVIDELGVITCDAIVQPTDPTFSKSATSVDYTALEEAFFAIMVLLVLVIIGIAVCVTTYFIMKRARVHILKQRYSIIANVGYLTHLTCIQCLSIC